ncbi:MAG: hypothetical protein AB1488_06970 [Nitrospirota bacterium]
MTTIDARGIYYRQLNELMKEIIRNGETEIEVLNVNGQRYIGDGITGKATITINGVPGNDLATFMNGPTIIVKNNAQDGIGNTMNEGKVVVYGHAGDVLGYGMRGGKLFIKGDVGYRVGIHMKGYMDKKPVIVIGGAAGNFLGEYMAGGYLILLGIEGNKNIPIAGDYLGTGMHGGIMYIRGEINQYQCGAEVGITGLDKEDKGFLSRILREYCDDLNFDYDKVISGDFVKIYPKSSRPYGRLYAY